MPLIQLQVSRDLMERLILEMQALSQQLRELNQTLTPASSTTPHTKTLKKEASLVSFDPWRAHLAQELIREMPPGMGGPEAEEWLEARIRELENDPRD